MTPDPRSDAELNRIISEWCPDVVRSYFGPEYHADFNPDFCTNLDAMHEAEEKLKGNAELEVNYYQTLVDVIEAYNGTMDYDLIHASARQRAGALVKVIEEGKE